MKQIIKILLYIWQHFLYLLLRLAQTSWIRGEAQTAELLSQNQNFESRLRDNHAEKKLCIKVSGFWEKGLGPKFNVHASFLTSNFLWVGPNCLELHQNQGFNGSLQFVLKSLNYVHFLPMLNIDCGFLSDEKQHLPIKAVTCFGRRILIGASISRDALKVWRCCCLPTMLRTLKNKIFVNDRAGSISVQPRPRCEKHRDLSRDRDWNF